MSVSGVLLQSRVIEEGTVNSFIDVSGYPSGIYFLEVLDNNKILTSGTILVTR